MPLVTLDDIYDAARTIRGVARVTPLVDVSQPGEPPLLLKCENLQLGGAFKIRGALNMIRRLSAEASCRGVITYSSGNHGRAVALASRLAGIPAVVVMPLTAPPIKVDAVRALGAEAILEGTTSIERKIRAEREAEQRALTIVPPFDHEWIIAGQGTIGIELVEQYPDLAEVYVPVGGGGLISGIAAAVKQLRPGVKVVGVEPSGAAKMAASLQAGHPVSLAKSASIADGLLPVRPGDLTFAHVREYVDTVVSVEDAEIVSAVGWLFQEARLVAEPSGAAALAALQRARRAGSAAGRGSSAAAPGPPARLRVGAGAALGTSGAAVAIISGGNIAAANLAELLDQPSDRTRSRQ